MEDVDLFDGFFFLDFVIYIFILFFLLFTAHFSLFRIQAIFFFLLHIRLVYIGLRISYADSSLTNQMIGDN